MTYVNVVLDVEFNQEYPGDGECEQEIAWVLLAFGQVDIAGKKLLIHASKSLFTAIRDSLMDKDSVLLSLCLATRESMMVYTVNLCDWTNARILTCKNKLHRTVSKQLRLI